MGVKLEEEVEARGGSTGWRDAEPMVTRFEAESGKRPCNARVTAKAWARWRGQGALEPCFSNLEPARQGGKRAAKGSKTMAWSLKKDIPGRAETPCLQLSRRAVLHTVCTSALRREKKERGRRWVC